MRLPTTKTDYAGVEAFVRNARKQIDAALPPGSVTPRHTDKGHFYEVPSGRVYPSVTGKLGHVKDESIQNFAMNEALRFVSEHMHETIVDGKVDMMKAIDMLDLASKAPRGILYDAGDIGTAIHDRRERYFQKWIDSEEITTVRPNILDYIYLNEDPRIHAGMLGLEEFLKKTMYIPIRTEVMVYSDKYQVAGMLDDIGVMWHEPKGKKGRWVLALMDVKTSNQMKAHYWLQVAMYHMMFRDLSRLVPDYNFILKLNKDRPDYKTEELKNMRRLVAGAKSVLKTAETMEFIKASRKDAGKTVIKI